MEVQFIRELNFRRRERWKEFHIFDMEDSRAERFFKFQDSQQFMPAGVLYSYVFTREF